MFAYASDQSRPKGGARGGGRVRKTAGMNRGGKNIKLGLEKANAQEWRDLRFGVE